MQAKLGSFRGGRWAAGRRARGAKKYINVNININVNVHININIWPRPGQASWPERADRARTGLLSGVAASVVVVPLGEVNAPQPHRFRAFRLVAVAVLTLILVPIRIAMFASVSVSSSTSSAPSSLYWQALLRFPQSCTHAEVYVDNPRNAEPRPKVIVARCFEAMKTYQSLRGVQTERVRGRETETGRQGNKEKEREREEERKRGREEERESASFRERQRRSQGRDDAPI